MHSPEGSLGNRRSARGEAEMTSERRSKQKHVAATPRVPFFSWPKHRIPGTWKNLEVDYKLVSRGGVNSHHFFRRAKHSAKRCR
jgi:hypothetical protein